MRQLFFDENCANTKTHPFAIYAIWTFDEINSHSFPLLLYLTILQILIPPSRKYWIPDIEKLETTYTQILLRLLRNFCKLSFFLNIQLDRNTAISIFVPNSWISKIKHYVSLTLIKIQTRLHISSSQTMLISNICNASNS